MKIKNIPKNHFSLKLSIETWKSIITTNLRVYSITNCKKKIGKYSKHSLFNAQKTNCIDNIYGHACDTTK